MAAMAPKGAVTPYLYTVSLFLCRFYFFHIHNILFVYNITQEPGTAVLHSILYSAFGFPSRTSTSQRIPASFV